MGWWEREISFESMIDSALWYFEMKLKPWANNLIDVAISNLGTVAGIGSSLWDDLEKWLDDRIDDFLPGVLLKITSARQLAQYLHDTLKIELEARIEGMSGLPEQVINLVMSKLEPKIVSARQYAEYLTDTLDIELDKRIKAANDYTKRVRSDLLSDLDRRIGIVMATMSNMETVAGASRVRFYNTLRAIIAEVEQEARDNLIQIHDILKAHITAIERNAKEGRAVLDSKLSSAIALVENSSKAARSVLEKTLNKALDQLEREAKEAREVLEGSIIVIIDSVEDALERALGDLERTFDTLLKALTSRVKGLEGWVDSFGTIFDNELNKYKGRVVTWIVDGFEGILDRVFR